MLDVVRRHRVIWKLRCGDRGPRGEPRRLDGQLRVTSETPDVVDAFTAVYGGERKPWGDAWEAYLPTDHLPVLLLPGQSITQSWERWDSGGCLRRCDGAYDSVSDGPCQCPPMPGRMTDRDACRPTTRLSILCPDVAVLGAGMLTTHGLIAAETLPQAVAIVEGALAAGQVVPATLRMVTHRGRRTYVVPQLEIVGMRLAELVSADSADGGPRPPALPSGDVPGMDSAQQGGPPVAGSHLASPEDVEALRTRIRALAAQTKKDLARDWVEAQIAPLGRNDFTDADLARASALVLSAEDHAPVQSRADESSEDFDRRRKHVMVRLAEIGSKSADARHALVSRATGGATESTAALTHEQYRAVLAEIAAIAAVEETP